MYNRYISNTGGTFHHPTEESPCTAPPPHEPTPHSAPTPPPSEGHDGLTGLLRHMLDRFHLDGVDTGDLLILGLLFFLFREDADEELLFALGLLLIL